MSWWRRLFQRDKVSSTKVRPLSLREQYQRKLKLYGELVAAGDAALELLAQLQGPLHERDYISPAYIHLMGTMAVDQTRRVLKSLEEFSREGSAELAKAFEKLAAQLEADLASPPAMAEEPLPLPFEKQIPPGPHLLASGRAYPAREGESGGALNIKAVWGWWPAVEEGTVRARRFQVVDGRAKEFGQTKAAPQAHWLTYHPEQGFIMAPLPSSYQDHPCLSPEEAEQIASYYALLAEVFPDLAEVEWGLGPERQVVILRGRRQKSPRPGETSGVQSPGESRYSQGIPIFPGTAAGPALWVDADRVPEAATIPEGTVLFSNKPSLSLARLLPRLAALVVETGDPRNHLAFLVREQRLPAVFALGEDSSRLPPGLPVRVDAGRPEISLGGEVDSFEPPVPEARPLLPAVELLRRLAPRLFPLKLDQAGKGPAPQNCESLHEVLYCAALGRRREMFGLSLRGDVSRKDAASLVTGRMVPILVIDGGGGLAVEGPTVTFEQVSSLPFRVFLAGMMSIPWPKGRPLDVKGFISVIGVTSTTPHAEEQLKKISFALVTDKYMNFSLCLGYHSSTIEAYVGSNLDNNYIRFHYQGGAASLDRRLRRLQMIGEILAQLGFTVTVQGDLLDGLAGGDPEPTLLKKLEILGRLEVYTKQMDMLMADDAVVSGHVSDFLEKHGRLLPTEPPAE